MFKMLSRDLGNTKIYNNKTQVVLLERKTEMKNTLTD